MRSNNKTVSLLMAAVLVSSGLAIASTKVLAREAEVNDNRGSSVSSSSTVDNRKGATKPEDNVGVDRRNGATKIEDNVTGVDNRRGATKTEDNVDGIDNRNGATKVEDNGVVGEVQRVEDNRVATTLEDNPQRQGEVAQNSGDDSANRDVVKVSFAQRIMDWFKRLF